MLTISPTHSVLLREGAPGVVAWDPNQQGKRAEIRAVRPPEPYKGKGIRYADEKVVIKETKKK
jgi:hypothetical protein